MKDAKSRNDLVLAAPAAALAGAAAPRPVSLPAGTERPDRGAAPAAVAVRRAPVMPVRAHPLSGAAPDGIRTPARAARPRRRHLGLLLGFLLLVILPAGGTAVYLYGFAADQFASHVAFSVRREEAGSAVELMGGLASMGDPGSKDTDILFDYIRSQPIVARIDQALDLRRIYAQPGDPVFGLNPGATIEDLTRYWRRMVRVSHDGASGLIEIRVQAFSPGDARAVAEAVLAESSALVNRLSAIARDDTIRHAADELERAVARLVQARQALTEFRATNQLADPRADLEGRMNVIAALEQQVTDARIDLEILHETTREADPRLRQTERRIAVLEDRIRAERARFGTADPSAGSRDPRAAEGRGSYASLLASYERLSVDLQFAEQAYVSALTAHEAARAQAQRQSRYLAAHVEPTLAETAEYPGRAVLIALIAGFALLGWSILGLGYYSIRDRK